MDDINSGDKDLTKRLDVTFTDQISLVKNLVNEFIENIQNSTNMIENLSDDLGEKVADIDEKINQFKI